MRLTGPEYLELHGALRDAFTDYGDLAIAMRGTGVQLEEIAAPGPMPQIVNAVIQNAEKRDALHKLIAAARAANPTNMRLLTVSAAIGLEPGSPVEDVPEGEKLATATAHFERMVDPQRGIADLGSFAARLQELLHQVCAVELGDHFGTGFLIGPQTVLTNYHVVERAYKGSFDPRNIRLRFDYQRLRDGRTTNAGVEYQLGADWIVAGSRYSDADTKPYDPQHVSAEDELDYAVLRPAQELGLGAPTGPITNPRGWLSPPAQPFEFAPDTFLMVIQHPCHDPISFDDAQDAVLRVNANGTRVQYRTNTMPGSSGSPVLNRHLELVALHHSGEPGGPDFMLECHQQVSKGHYNEGIPIASIQAHAAAHGVGWVFGGETPCG